jgi:hypothetical protein
MNHNIQRGGVRRKGEVEAVELGGIAKGVHGMVVVQVAEDAEGLEEFRGHVRGGIHEDAGEGVATEVFVGTRCGKVESAAGEIVAHGPEPGEEEVPADVGDDFGVGKFARV